MTYQNATPPTPGTPEDRSTQFVPVVGGNEGASAEGLLVTAYLLMWAALIGFLWLTWRRQNRIEERLAVLDANVRRAAEKS